MFITETYLGKIVQVYPDQGWGIIQSCRYPESKVIFLLRDQRGLDKKGNIDPERIRTTAPERETVVKFTIGRSRKTLDGVMVFLWAKQYQEPRKKKLPQAHFYPQYEQHEQHQETLDVAVAVSKEQKPATIVAPASAPEFSSAETRAKKVQGQNIADNTAQANQSEIKTSVAQETFQLSTQKTKKVAQDSGHRLPRWVAEEAISALKQGEKIHLGAVGS